MMHLLRTFSIMHAYSVKLSKKLEIMEKLYASKTFLKTAGGRMHTPHPTPGYAFAIITETIKRVWHISDTRHH